MKTVSKKATKLHVKTGDMVKVISGDERGKTGKIASVNPTTSRVIIEGLNLVTKHSKPSANNPQGGISKMEASRSEEHTSELQSQSNLVCRLLLEKKKKSKNKK